MINHNGNANKMVGEDHLPDTGKMVSDTPRTDEEYERLFEIYRNAERFHGPLCCAFENDMRLCRQLERELNAAKQRIKRLYREVELLRLYGNKDCTAMADDALRKEAKP